MEGVGSRCTRKQWISVKKAEEVVDVRTEDTGIIERDVS